MGSTWQAVTQQDENRYPGYAGSRKNRRVCNRNIEFIVLPGQQMQARYLGLEELTRSPPDGIIHVFANGYARIRGETAKLDLIRKGIDSIDKLRESNFELESNNLEDTCRFIRSCHRSETIKEPSPLDGDLSSWATVASVKSRSKESSIGIDR